jgi:hypothetical protein
VRLALNGFLNFLKTFIHPYMIKSDTIKDIQRLWCRIQKFWSCTYYFEFMFDKWGNRIHDLPAFMTKNSYACRQIIWNSIKMKTICLSDWTGDDLSFWKFTLLLWLCNKSQYLRQYQCGQNQKEASSFSDFICILPVVSLRSYSYNVYK